jgi:lycopene cyclase domain-containing protein
MNYFYLILDLGVLFFPFVLSFDKKVSFHKKWQSLLFAILMVGIPFLIHDYFFTQNGIWGFESKYLSGLYIVNLPIEEVLFFVVVPYATLFIYQCVKVYFNGCSFVTFNRLFYLIISLYSLIVLVLGWGNWYSLLVSVGVLMLLFLLYSQKKIQFIPISFTLSIIPFALMNSVLTGLITKDPIVWYNNAEILGVRFGTIPVEDLLYSFLLIVSNILVMEWAEQNLKRAANLE